VAWYVQLNTAIQYSQPGIVQNRPVRSGRLEEIKQEKQATELKMRHSTIRLF
jgi:hypothetical protein